MFFLKNSCCRFLFIGLSLLTVFVGPTSSASEGFVFPLETCFEGNTKVSCSHQNGPVNGFMDQDPRGDTFVTLFTSNRGSGASIGRSGEQCVYPETPHPINDLLLNYNGSHLTAGSNKSEFICYDDHVGIDYRTINNRGTDFKHNVVAAADGKIGWLGRPESGKPLRWVEINHQDGIFEPYSTRYLHLDSINPSLTEGDMVKAGDIIGVSGTSGADGPHLHFEIRVCSSEKTFCDIKPKTVDPYGLKEDVQRGVDGQIVSSTVGKSSLWKNWPLVEREDLRPEVPSIAEFDEAKERSIFPIDDIDYSEFQIDSCSDIGIEFSGLEGGSYLAGIPLDEMPVKLFRITATDKIEVPNSVCSNDGYSGRLLPGRYQLQVGDIGFLANRVHNYTQEISIRSATCGFALKQNVQLKDSCGVTAPSQPELVAPGPQNYPGPTLNTEFPVFQWQPSSNASHYELYIYKLDNGQFEVFSDKNVSTNSFSSVFESLARGNDYTWRVRAVGVTGVKGSYSNYGYFRLSSLSGTDDVPAPPTILSPGTSNSAVLSVTTPRPTMTWSRGLNVDRYGIYIRDLDTRAFVYFDENLPKSETSFRLPRGLLVDGHSYKWNMSSFNEIGVESTVSNSLYFKYADVAESYVDLELSGSRIDDNSSAGSSGDDDGYPEQNETIDLDVFLENTGDTDIENMELSLSSDNGCLSFQRDEYARDVLRPGRRTAMGGFLVNIGDCGNDVDVDLELLVNSDQGSFDYSFPVRVYSDTSSGAKIEITSVDVDDNVDDMGNSDGTLNAGEEVDYVVEITNTGTEKSESLTGTLSGDHHCLEFTGGPNNRIGKVSAGSSREFNYGFIVDGDCPLPARLTLQHVVTSDVGARWVETIEVPIQENEHRPDIAVSDVVYNGPRDIRAHDNVEILFDMSNLGLLRASDIVVGLFYSRDSAIQTSDVLLSDITEGKINPGSTESFSISSKRVSELGRGYLAVCSLRLAGEVNLTNNCSNGIEIDVDVELVPDLQISVESLSGFSFPFTDYEGFPHVNVEVKNVGAVSSASTNVLRYISRDFLSLNDSTFSGTSGEVSSLNSGALWSYDWTIDHPSQLGEYWASFCVEPDEDEVDFSNNCESFKFNVRPLEVDRRPVSPVVLSGSSGEALSASSLASGQNMLVTVRIINEGDNSALGSVELRYSASKKFDEQASFIGKKELKFLSSGSTDDVTFSFVAPEAEKQYWLQACSVDVQAEQDESNDCIVVPFRVGDEDLCFPLVSKDRKIAMICL